MTKHGSGPGDYIRKVRDDTQSYIRELLEDNENLRRQVAGLQTERERLEEERIDLREQMLTLKMDLDKARQDESRLRRRITEAEQESHQFSARYVEVEEQNNKLANLYVASYRLHETSDRDDVLVALQEIVINLIGSEDFVILERKRDSERLTVAASFGVEPERIADLDLTRGPIADAARSGELYLVDPESGAGGDVLACIPLKLSGQVHGVIAIFRLLDHKGMLEELDYELFDLLASHAATALCVSGAPHGAPIVAGDAGIPT